MAKNTYVKEEVETLIARVKLKHLKWTAKEVRNEVDFIVHKSNPKLPSGWPGLSKVQKVLSIVKSNLNKRPVDRRDFVWSTATIAEYPIPAEALPTILRLWGRERGKLFTIRQAQWAARLYTVTENLDELYSLSQECAFYESCAELIGVPFVNTLLIDMWMLNLVKGDEMALEVEKKVKEGTEELQLRFQADVEAFNIKKALEFKDSLAKKLHELAKKLHENERELEETKELLKDIRIEWGKIKEAEAEGKPKLAEKLSAEFLEKWGDTYERLIKETR